MEITKEELEEARRNGFRDDGCTCAPDFDFAQCCEVHDYLYWRGGWRGSRAEADKMLFLCIKRQGERNGKPKLYLALACIYWLAVRLFGGKAFARKAAIKKELAKRDAQ